MKQRQKKIGSWIREPRKIQIEQEHKRGCGRRGGETMYISAWQKHNEREVDGECTSHNGLNLEDGSVSSSARLNELSYPYASWSQFSEGQIEKIKLLSENLNEERKKLGQDKEIIIQAS